MQDENLGGKTLPLPPAAVVDHDEFQTRHFILRNESTAEDQPSHYLPPDVQPDDRTTEEQARKMPLPLLRERVVFIRIEWDGRRQIRFVFFIHTSSEVAEEAEWHFREDVHSLSCKLRDFREDDDREEVKEKRRVNRNLIIEIFNLQNQLCSERCLHLSNYHDVFS